VEDASELPSVDELVARLRARVEERRHSGAYPPDLERDLDEHFQRIAAHRVDPYDFDQLRHKLGALDEAMAFSSDIGVFGSDVPGGELVHRTVAKVVRRQTQAVIEQVQQFADEVRNVLQEVVAVLQHPDGHRHPDMAGQVDAILERLISYERVPANPETGAAELRRRIEKLEAANSTQRFRPWFDNAQFENALRGSPEDLRARYADLAARFVGYEPTVDLGFGRGEFLELLSDLDIDAIGVEVDPDLVQAGRARGLKVEVGDAVGWLSRAVDESLGGIALIQVIEHLEPQEVVEVVALARDKLRPGGLIVVETLNPESLYIFARAFFADPTHDKPIHPAYLTFLFREAGFSTVEIEWRSPPPPDEVLLPLTGRSAEDPTAATFNANVERLNRILFGPQDYALLAIR
jgi:SAM-dependent methyltransferase